MTYQKAITDAVTGKTTMVDLSAEEVAEIETKLVLVKAEADAQTANEQLAAVEAEQARQKVDELPSAADVNAAKTIEEVKDVMLKLLSVIEVLVKNSGLKS